MRNAEKFLTMKSFLQRIKNSVQSCLLCFSLCRICGWDGKIFLTKKIFFNRVVTSSYFAAKSVSQTILFCFVAGLAVLCWRLVIMMIVKKILNNNAVVTNNSSEREIIAVGKGVGFHHKRGDEISESPPSLCQLH